ncbi:MAG: hypothetical protein LBC20_03490 [Planctomycetaceae bacterium]|jgi:hypothetical protein|nr:hypothetical protein [Planctomycetaceae bacterium]
MGELLTRLLEIDTRHGELLDRLAELDRQINEVLEDWTKSKASFSTDQPKEMLEFEPEITLASA